MLSETKDKELTPERIEFLVGQLTKSRDFYKAGQNSDCQRQAKMLDDTLTALAMVRRTQAAEAERDALQVKVEHLKKSIAEISGIVTICSCVYLAPSVRLWKRFKVNPDCPVHGENQGGQPE